MYKPINGWTKDKILEVYKNRKFENEAWDDNLQNCAYETADGNRCAVGIFIPDGHPGLKLRDGVEILLEKYSELMNVMPLELTALRSLQNLHDSNGGRFFNVKQSMIEWVQANVEG